MFDELDAALQRRQNERYLQGKGFRRYAWQQEYFARWDRHAFGPPDESCIRDVCLGPLERFHRGPVLLAPRTKRRTKRRVDLFRAYGSARQWRSYDPLISTNAELREYGRWISFVAGREIGNRRYFRAFQQYVWDVFRVNYFAEID